MYKESRIPPFWQVPVESSPHGKARSKIYLPPDFEEGSGKRYPTVVYVYGGPGFQNTDLAWNQFDYQSYLAGAKVGKSKKNEKESGGVKPP